ncbi:MAG: hypothetical protein QM780_04040 [Hyphomicrobium sp.]|uniref:hypothetical protein n=1 Tax=Hyphomicrobium sp. TaxID=82 RepID=UPI0039E322CF
MANIGFGEVRRAARLMAILGMTLVAALWLAGCGATVGDLATASVTDYTQANVFAPAGYNISNNADGSIHVTAAGSPSTPSDRLTKIALAAAADYGNEQHQKTFTATPPQTTFKCGKTKTTDKGNVIAIKPIDLRVVSIDVTYGRDGIAPAARNSKETAEQLKSELQTDTVPPDVQAASTQEVAQQCGRT